MGRSEAQDCLRAQIATRVSDVVERLLLSNCLCVYVRGSVNAAVDGNADVYDCCDVAEGLMRFVFCGTPTQLV